MSHRTVNIEVYCDRPEGEREVFAVASDHRPDLPKPFNNTVQQWARMHFDYLEVGDTVREALTLVYEPNGEIVEIQVKGGS
jgi:hypothetical protein